MIWALDRGTFAYFDYPRIPGHEFSAEIIEIDDNDRGLKPGMIVTCNPYFNCTTCYSCKRGIVNACMNNETMGCQRDGAFQEYITMPIERVYDGKGFLRKYWRRLSHSASVIMACSAQALIKGIRYWLLVPGRSVCWQQLQRKR